MLSVQPVIARACTWESAHAMMCCVRLCVLGWMDQHLVTGCFVDTDLRLYFNNKGTYDSSYGFARSLCLWRNAEDFALPSPITNMTTNACGENRSLPVYKVAAIFFEKAIDELKNRSISKFVLQLGEGEAYLEKTMHLADLDAVIAGVKWTSHEQPLTTINLQGSQEQERPMLWSDTKGNSRFCLQDVLLFNWRSKAGGAAMFVGSSSKTVVGSSASKSVVGSSAGLKNAGQERWSSCGKKQGPCAFCGTGLCCRFGWHDHSNGCDGTIGVQGQPHHMCAAQGIIFPPPTPLRSCLAL